MELDDYLKSKVRYHLGLMLVLRSLLVIEQE